MVKMKFFLLLIGITLTASACVVSKKEKVELQQKQQVAALSVLHNAIMPQAYYSEPLLISTNFFHVLVQDEQSRTKQYSSLKGGVRIVNPGAIIS